MCPLLHKTLRPASRGLPPGKARLRPRSPLRYVFAKAGGSKFHITSKKATNFGNYPQPVLIRGRNIACDARETTFLIKHVAAGAGLALGCSRAGVVTGR